jgi:shikimate kinase
MSESSPTSSVASPGVGRPMVVLIVPMGAGKTSVGAVLAERWRVELRDTDLDIERAQGKPISEIFIDDGEERFRELERAAVAAALAEHRGVLSLGGGAVLDDGTRAALRGHRVVFLDVGFGEAVKRVGLATTRPLLIGNMRAQLKALLDARRPAYEAASVASVLTDGLDAEAVADAVEGVLA